MLLRQLQPPGLQGSTQTEVSLEENNVVRKGQHRHGPGFPGQQE